MSRIKLITLDLDNTLWDVDSIIIKAEKMLITWLSENIPDALAHYQPDNLNRLRQEVVARHADKTHDLSFMRTQILFEVMRQTGLAEADARRQAQAAFNVFFEGRNQVVLFDGALEMLHSLSREFDIIALTNGNANINRTGLADFFSGAYSAADVGNKKPHPAMFKAPLSALQLKPDQAIHIGDHLVDDIQGAEGVGMHSIWVNLVGAQPVDVTPSREVTHLGAVKDAVQQIASG
jgi:FMN hydrolase / 5-amino-6-(5-phospho-D-ribitylamino)uracil phosphatase